MSNTSSIIWSLILANPANQVCNTAVWSSTFKIVGGLTSTAAAAANRLESPLDVTFDGNGFMYVADYGNHRIQRFPPGRCFLSFVRLHHYVHSLM